MANPLAIKAVISIATDKKTWKVVGTIIAAVLTPVIMIIVLFSSVAEYNSQLSYLCFSEAEIPRAATQNERDFVVLLRRQLEDLERHIDAENSEINSGILNALKIKTVFFHLQNVRLNAGTGLIQTEDENQDFFDFFVECFTALRVFSYSKSDGEKVWIVMKIPDANMEIVCRKLSRHAEISLEKDDLESIDLTYEYL